MKPIPSIGTLKMESIGEVRFDLDLDFKGQKRSSLTLVPPSPALTTYATGS